MPARYGRSRWSFGISAISSPLPSGQFDCCGRAEAAHVATVAQPANPGSRTGGRRSLDEPQRPRHRADGGRQGLSRARQNGAASGGGCQGSGATCRRAAPAARFLVGLSVGRRNRPAARGGSHSARRISRHRYPPVERLFALACQGPDAAKARCCLHPVGGAHGRSGLPARAHRSAGLRLSERPSAGIASPRRRPRRSGRDFHLPSNPLPRFAV